MAQGAAVDVVVRQEDIRFADASTPHAATLAGRVAMRSFVGSRVQYLLAFGGTELIAEALTNGPHAGLEVDAPVRVAVEPQHVYVTPAAHRAAA
jgi:hypothetical protein